MAETNPSISTQLADGMRQLRDRLGPHSAWTLGKRHEFGSALRDAHESEKAGYGAKLMARIAKALGIPNEGLLNKHKQFAACFDREELAHLAGARTPKGGPLAWSHVRLVMEVEKKAKRRDLIEQAATKGWTSARLGAAIRDLKGEKTRGGGPKPSRPESLQDLVLQMNLFLSEWENRHEQVWAKEECSLPKLVKATPKRRASEKTLEELEALSKAWARAVDRSRAMVKAAEIAIGRMRGQGKGVREEQAGT